MKHYYVMEAAWVVTKTKTLLELKNGYCPQDRKEHDSCSEVTIETFKPFRVYVQTSILESFFPSVYSVLSVEPVQG